MPSASVSGVLRYAVVNADFYAPAASKEYLPARKKRLLKIAVFGLVGEAPNYWRSEVLDGALYWRNTLNTNGYYFEPRRGTLLEINRYLPACLYLRLARCRGVKTGNSWRTRF